MPFIAPKDRLQYDTKLNQIQEIKTKGDLEYCIYKLMLKFMKTRDFRYTNLHDCTYAAIHAGEEFKRRFLDVRENQAIKSNGDIT